MAHQSRSGGVGGKYELSFPMQALLFVFSCGLAVLLILGVVRLAQNGEQSYEARYQSGEFAMQNVATIALGTTGSAVFTPEQHSLSPGREYLSFAPKYYTLFPNKCYTGKLPDGARAVLAAVDTVVEPDQVTITAPPRGNGGVTMCNNTAKKLYAYVWAAR